MVERGGGGFVVGMGWVDVDVDGMSFFGGGSVPRIVFREFCSTI